MLPVWQLCKTPDARIAIIAKNDNEANMIGTALMAELSSNELLIADFGEFKPELGDRKQWAGKMFTIRQRQRQHKSPSVVLFGSGSKQALGHRTDWLICDDIIHEDNSATPEARDKIREWFNLGPATSGEFHESRLTVVGTMFDPSDLYHDLMELEVYRPVDKIDAIVDEEKKVSLWPERWPWGKLMEQKAGMGTLDFNKRYRNIAVDKSRMAFREEWIKGGTVGTVRFNGCLDRNYKIGDYEQDWWRYAGFDPAVGTTKSRKFCAHITLASGSCKEHERCFWVVDLEREQLTLPQQVDLIIDKHDLYNLFSTLVEANSYQAGLYQAVKTKLDDQGKALKIDPHYTTRVNKPDPVMGVMSMARFFENQQFHIPWADEYSRRKMERLVDELVLYPGKFTDTVMALWMAWREAYKGQNAMKSTNYLKKIAPSWEKRTRRRTVMNPYYNR